MHCTFQYRIGAMIGEQFLQTLGAQKKWENLLKIRKRWNGDEELRVSSYLVLTVWRIARVRGGR